MRIRPFFWIFLAAVCASVVLFASLVSKNTPIPMHAYIDQISATTTHSTFVRLRLTDPEGTPIDQAAITPHVSMLDMDMEPQQMRVQQLGEGMYLAQIRFSMPGAWKIEIAAHADGFDAVRQSIQLTII